VFGRRDSGKSREGYVVVPELGLIYANTDDDCSKVKSWVFGEKNK